MLEHSYGLLTLDTCEGMARMQIAKIIVSLLFLVSTSYAAPLDTLVTDGYDEKEMDQAIAKAKKTVDKFIKVLQSGKGKHFAVKAPIHDGEAVEHFWITDLSYKDGKFIGLINNDPGIVKNVTIGQKWTIDKKDISDWMFMRDNKMHGNFTLRPLLKTMPEAEAKKLRAILVDP